MKRALGDRYSIAWLAEALACPQESAEALDGYWIVANAHARTNALTVFSRRLHIDLPRLLGVFAEADRMAARPASFKAALKPAMPAMAPIEKTRSSSIGSNGGARAVRPSQPTIVWRRQRHGAAVVGQ